MTFTPSPEQSAFYSALRTTPDSLMLLAVAGSGKTTTIVNSFEHIPSALSQSILFLAFNKNIATELESRVPVYCTVKTFHALGLAAWKRHTGFRYYGKGINGDKVFNIIRDWPSGKDRELYAAAVKRLVGFGKNAGIGTTLLDESPAAWEELIAHNNITLDHEDADSRRLVELASETLAMSNETCGDVIDYDDMLYLPLQRRITFDKQTYIFIDEAQDTNGVQRALLCRMLTPTGRLVAVGDPSQAIYGFRGADSNAMSLLREEFNMKLLPLSVSYRCSKAVVAEAQKYETTI